VFSRKVDLDLFVFLLPYYPFRPVSVKCWELLTDFKWGVRLQPDPHCLLTDFWPKPPLKEAPRNDLP
jgi:hypothetical protein